MKTNELIGFMIAGLGAFFCILGYYTNRISEKIDSINKKADGRLNSQNARTDQLYKMFCELLKDKK